MFQCFNKKVQPAHTQHPFRTRNSQSAMNQLSLTPPAELLSSLLKLNTTCFDCGVGNTDWVSMGFGIYLCLNCAGFHRSMGTHITSVRSCNLDEWTTIQVENLSQGGNVKFRNHVESLKLNAELSAPQAIYAFPHVLYYK